jgi:hypothetical protein
MKPIKFPSFLSVGDYFPDGKDPCWSADGAGVIIHLVYSPQPKAQMKRYLDLIL